MRNYSHLHPLVLSLLMTTVLIINHHPNHYLLVRHDSETLDLDVHSLEHLFSLLININDFSLESRLLRDEIKTTLSFFLLKLERDTTDGTSLDSLHQVLCIRTIDEPFTVT